MVLPSYIDPAEEVRFIESFQTWPMYPWLPIKRYVDGQDHPECAMIHAGNLTVVIHAGLHGSTPDQVVAAKTTKYESIEALVKDGGWYVD